MIFTYSNLCPSPYLIETSTQGKCAGCAANIANSSHSSTPTLGFPYMLKYILRC